MQVQQPVIRTYKGRDRRSAEDAYRLDAQAAGRAAWYPVAHRWTTTWEGHELAVVFEFRGPGSGAVEGMRGPDAAAVIEAHSPYARPAGAPAFPAASAPPATGDAPAYAPPAYPADAPPPYPVYAPPAYPAAAQVTAPIAPAWSEDAGLGAGVEGSAAAAAQVEEAAGPGGSAEEVAWAAGSAETIASELETPAAPVEFSPTEAPVEPSLDAVEPSGSVESLAAEAPAPAGAPAPAETPDAAAAAAEPGAEPTSAALSHARATFHAIDLHCAGEPLRLVRAGFPAVPFAPILERRRWLREHADVARQILMFEPRGHRDMYGAILLPPYRDDADVAVLFMHNEGYSTMCGHGTIAIATALLEERLYPVTEPVTTIRMEIPAGLVTAVANVAPAENGHHEVRSVRFRNVPAYLHAAGLWVHADGVTLAGSAAVRGALSVDLAFGGAYYGIVTAADLGLRVVPDQIGALTAAGAAITDVLRRDHTPVHPTDPDLGFVYGTIIVDDAPSTSPDGRGTGADLRNVTIFADGEADRSPCGSGTSAILAQRHAQGRVQEGHDIVNAGITGEAFRGRVEGRATVGTYDAVITSVEGSAYVTGYHTFVVDDRDPLGDGFLLR